MQRESLAENSAQAAFTSLFKWPFLFNQLLGQFPHPSSGIVTPTYKFKLLSFKTIYTILLLLITCAWETNYYSRLRSKFSVVRKFGPTEHFAHNLMVIVTSLCGIHLQILSILNAKQIIHFCQLNCSLLAKFQGAKFNLKCRRIGSLRKQGRNIVFASVLIVGTFVAYIHWYSSWKIYKLIGRRWIPDIEILFGTGFWALTSYSRMFNPLLLVFMKLYKVLLKEIVDDLEAQKRVLFEGPNEHHPKIFFEELFILRRKHTKTLFSKVHNHKEQLRDLNYMLQTRFDLFVEVCKVVREFNNCMGTEILWNISSDVTNITVYFFLSCFYMQSGKISTIVSILIPLCFCAWNVFMLSSVSGKLTDTFRTVIPRILEDFPVDQLDLKLKRTLNLWQVKMETNPPTICAHGFFTINQAMSTTVVSGMSTFLVALIQFRQADKSGK